MVNTTYLESVKVKKHYACLRIPPVCAEWVNKMETRWREENITRVVSKESCCPGYKRKGQGRGKEKICAPWCSRGCINGECTAPETCTCKPSFSGERCEKSGCPGGRWGAGCKEECSCKHGGTCHGVTGKCSCTPGYTGVKCEEKCSEGSWGSNCIETCSCSKGTTCHHVTGECLPCAPGLWGEGCKEKCRCDEEGTELCGHTDGRCFCKGNRFGLRCELLCPFGYINHTCLTKPIGSACQCPNDLYTCDLALGCICPQGVDCGLEVINRVVELAPLSSSPSYSNASSAAPVVVSVLVVALIAVVLIIIYYRRRMKVMKRDLALRSEPSVYYSDPRPSPHQGMDQPSQPLADSNNFLLNNVRLTLDSQARLQNSGPTTMVNRLQTSNNAPLTTMVKNVNVDNFKLGNNEAGCSSHHGREGEDEEQEVDERLTEEQVKDINVFLGESNGSGKVGKELDLEKMIRNDLKADNLLKAQGAAAATQSEEDPFADFESKLNVALPSRKNM